MKRVHSTTGVEYDLHDPDDVLRLVEDNDWNGSQASRDIGLTTHAVRNWIRKHGLQEAVKKGREDFLRGQGLNRANPTDRVKSRAADARAREVLRTRRKAMLDSPEVVVERVGRDKIIEALIASFGVVRDAAELLAVKRATLLKLVATDPDFMAAARQGEKEMRLDMRDKMLLAAQGRLSLTKDESSWMERLARWDRMEGGKGDGGVSDSSMAGMPEEDLDVTELDLPDFTVPESALGSGPKLPN